MHNGIWSAASPGMREESKSDDLHERNVRREEDLLPLRAYGLLYYGVGLRSEAMMPKLTTS